MDLLQADEALKPLKSQRWNQWFTNPIPVIDNKTPIEAARTAGGRAKLDELLALYDSMSSASDLNLNIPTRYAKWKLGYGPGSATEFAEEEAILNYTSPRRRTERTERHTAKLEKKKIAIFIPRRCEVIGCDKRGHKNVMACSKCKCAYYCGKGHQVQDWPRHKLDCKVISTKFDIQAKPFESSAELEKYPLGCFPVADSVRGNKCFICHASSSEVDITYTSCCNMPVCDNSHEYQLNSYSRDFCHRSHLMYTNCSTHAEEEHPGDWRECERCNTARNGARPFASTNRFCVTPCLEDFLPQGSMLTYPCDTDGCRSRFLPGHSASVHRYGRNICTQCAR